MSKKKSKAELQKELSASSVNDAALFIDGAPIENSSTQPVEVNTEIKKPKVPGNPKAKKEKAAKAAKEPKSKKEKVESVASPVEEVKEVKKKGPGKIQQILTFFKAGMPTSEIAKQFFLDADGNKVATGTFTKDGEPIFETLHPTTISIQVNRYKKANPDIYPPVPPAKTKKEIAAEKKAAKEAEKIAKAEQQPSAEANAETTA